MPRIDEVYDLEKRPILVSGAHRAGTTWLGRMLAATPKTAYISEPLNVLHRPGVFGATVEHWYTYICTENESVYLPAFQKLLCLRYDLWAELRSLRSSRDFMRMGRDASVFWLGKLTEARPLLKDPFAVFSLAWFVQRLNCEVVVVVRHPAAVTSSLKRLGWTFDFVDLLQQPLLMRDWLEPFRLDMEAMLDTPQDVVGQSALLWRIIYSVVTCYQEILKIHMIRHEDLSLHPVSGYHNLYESLGLRFTPRVEQAILNSSNSENPRELSQKAVHSVRVDSRANLKNWIKRLSLEEIDRIRRMTEDIARRYYSDEDWE
jgi:hypothetical protein